MRLARLVSNQSRSILVIVALLCAAGLFAAWRLPIAVFPQTDFPRIVIIVDNGEAPAAQTLASVTLPIEEAMNGVPGIARIKSKTARGSSEINLYFDWSVDIRQTLPMVQARLSQLSSTLPSTAEVRNVERLTFAVFPVTGYSLISDKRDQASLRDVANYILRPELARLPGVATVGVAGGKSREFHVTIDPERLAAHNVSAQQVVDAVHNSNIIVSPGLIEENHQLELALISGQAKKPDELNNIVVATVNNAPVTIADVATVGAGVEPQYTMVTADGHPAALVNINRQPEANTVAVVDEVKEKLGDARPDSERCASRALLRSIAAGTRFDQFSARFDHRRTAAFRGDSLCVSAELGHDLRGDSRDSGDDTYYVPGDVARAAEFRSNDPGRSRCRNRLGY